jgi:hypothetical protein
MSQRWQFFTGLLNLQPQPQLLVDAARGYPSPHLAPLSVVYVVVQRLIVVVIKESELKANAVIMRATND